MHAQDLTTQLAAHLGGQIAAAHLLLKILEEEHTALKGADAHALDRAGSAKIAALNEFERLEQARRQLCRLHDGRAAFERLIDTLDRGTALRSAWQHLLELTGRCRDANQTNGLIIAYRQKQIRQLLGVLRGASGAHTYSPSGTPNAIAASARALARA